MQREITITMVHEQDMKEQERAKPMLDSVTVKVDSSTTLKVYLDMENISLSDRKIKNLFKCVAFVRRLRNE